MITKCKLNIVPLLTLIFLGWSCNNTQQEADFVTYDEPQEIITNQVNRVEPPNWWVGFKNNKLQLLVHHPNIGNATPNVKSNSVTLKNVHKAKSNHYLFLDLVISEVAKEGYFNINFDFEDGTQLQHSYQLKARTQQGEDFVGFNSSDVMYLITPDRFANGNPNNDSVEGLRETAVNRSNDYGRHGGDIEGIINHLDYIADMGFTAIWSSPLLTNDMPQSSYHGYAMTDFYEVDPRFGTLEDYINLSKKGKDKGIKLIMDQVANHCGSYHWWMEDLPFEDWLNFQEHFENNLPIPTSNHFRTTNQDGYAAEVDKQLMANGWFVSSMPDLNQRNPFLATYLIQNSIWWVETLELGGIRQDTYPYPDKAFMSEWAGAIMTEYPNFNIVGEEWSSNPLLIGYWQRDANNKDGYKSNLRSSMDFAMKDHVIAALTEQETWGTGLVKLYEGLAMDFHYASPEDLLIFGDNHDMDRIFTALNEDVTNTKMAMSFLLMLPRIPQIYYGTEILMQNTAKPGDHGLIRTDFPGGWEGDAVNAFTGEGLSTQAADMQTYLKTILNFRKQSKAIHNGNTLHFAPKNGVYVLVRHLDDEVVVYILNKNEAPVEIDLDRFKELNLEGSSFKNIVTGEMVAWDHQMTLPEKGSYILSKQ